MASSEKKRSSASKLRKQLVDYSKWVFSNSSLHDGCAHLHLVLLRVRVGLGAHAGVRVRPKRTPEQQDEWLWFVHFIVYPSSALLDSKRSPLLFSEQAAAGHFLVDVLREQHVAVLEQVVLVLLGVFYVVGEVWHE